MQSLVVQSVVSDATRAEELDRCEESHWWYAGLRDLLTRLVQSPRFGVRLGGSVLDVGCGAGANLRLLGQLLQPSYLGGFDVNEHCLAAARRKCPQADVYQSDLRRPEFHRDEYDLITCCDVLCAAGLDRCGAGLSQLADRLSTQGRIIFHLPAYPWLFGEHDIAVGNIERHRADAVRSALAQAGLTPQFTTYRLCLSFPAIVAARFWRRSRRSPAHVAAPQSDLTRSQRFSCWWLSLATLENAILSRGRRWPCGASLVVVAGKAKRPSPANSGM